MQSYPLANAHFTDFQFDTSATAVIMTRHQTRAKYENLLKGSQEVESKCVGNHEVLRSCQRTGSIALHLFDVAWQQKAVRLLVLTQCIAAAASMRTSLST
jgi:hypothetical protein